MIIKFNFELSKGNNFTNGVLTINNTSGSNPIYDITSTTNNTSVILEDVIKLYIESRVFEIFSNARQNEQILSSDEYQEILKSEVPKHLLESVLGDMKYCIQQDAYLQAS
ncbi:hypothetical protein [Flammeovirga pacifica]|uniref:Uncharacterized protein n=1 Tax=Flammeovirga pacifica TaxID=915059 RepID=A0A1S1Z434_FLAPC|nr:hypothetical protein [Flammeovirga pacifica]OHX68046.1 hypothetical protein NH26_17700 [Flammeovirga pacifica]